MPSVTKGLYKWLFRRSATLEDLADRLNHFWTFGLLLLFAAIISWRQAYKQPLYCWQPAQYTHSMVEYVEDMCWNSYYLLDPKEERTMQELLGDKINTTNQEKPEPRFTEGWAKDTPVVHQHLPVSDSEPIKKLSMTRTLYQWLPLVLCLQALLFKLPNLVMYIFHGYSGISFDKLAGLTNGYEHLTLQERSILSRRIGRYLYNCCRQCENCLPIRQLTLIWFLVKILYCVNIITQISLVNGFLAPENSTSFGDVIRGNLYNDRAMAWRDSPAFPKRVFCDFQIVQLHNTQRWRVQCNVSANYFSEFAYMFIWVWMVFVAVVTCASLLIWLIKTLIPVFRKRFITNALGLVDETEVEFDVKVIPDYNIVKFCELVGEDGVTALKLTGASSSELMVCDIVKNMWQTWSASCSGNRGGQILSTPGYQVQPSATAPMYPTLQPGHVQGGGKME